MRNLLRVIPRTKQVRKLHKSNFNFMVAWKYVYYDYGPPDHNFSGERTGAVSFIKPSYNARCLGSFVKPQKEDGKK